MPEEAGNKSVEPAANGMGSATRTSSNNSNRSTITFEKQKVMPRTRTQSVQSVLSSISLRSMLGKHQEETMTTEAPLHSSVGVPATQLIQSPAMVSVQKKSASSSTYNDGIGQRLPFTNDKRRPDTYLSSGLTRIKKMQPGLQKAGTERVVTIYGIGIIGYIVNDFGS